MTVSEIEQWIDNDEGLYDWWRSTKQSKRAFIRQYRAEIEAAINNVTSGRKRAHYLVYDKPKGPMNGLGGLGSLGGMRYATDFTKDLKPFFDWCLKVFIAALDEKSASRLRGIINSRRFKIQVLLHHRKHKLWETYARSHATHSVVGGITRTSVTERARNRAKIQLPFQMLTNGALMGRVFIHEFIHATQHYMIWHAERVEKLPVATVAWRNDAAEEDAERAENHFVMAVWREATRLGHDAQRDPMAAQALVLKHWMEAVLSSKRLMQAVVEARLDPDNPFR